MNQNEKLKAICEAYGADIGENGAALFNACLLQAEAHGWTRMQLAGKLLQIHALLIALETVRASPQPEEWFQKGPDVDNSP